jgi:hypothetical protein
MLALAEDNPEHGDIRSRKPNTAARMPVGLISAE